jgi:TatD DNase family protein
VTCPVPPPFDFIRREDFFRLIREKYHPTICYNFHKQSLIMLTDTHCHLDVNQFNDDRDAAIQRAVESGVGRMLVPGLDLESSRRAVELADTHVQVYAAVGFHPTDIEKMTPESFEELRQLAQHPRVVAIGEIGLDYYWVKDPAQRLAQRQKLSPQLELAIAVNKPIILHLREENNAETGDATNDLFGILDAWHEKLLQLNHPLYFNPGVFHSFNGNHESARRAIAMHYQIGVTGPITYKNAESQRELVKGLPLDRILIETDSPFQTPVPHRGRRNEPVFVGHIADKIAELHHTSRKQVATITAENANRLFGWEADS